ncbi:MAG TPA: transcription elongation factor [Rariglobus sp.]
MSPKSALIDRIRTELRARFERLAAAAREAHAAATDPSSKAESKYDTRNLEASYLATGQARQVEELAAAIRIFESFDPPAFAIDEAIDAGALVETDLDGETAFFLLAPAAGGLTLDHLGAELTVLTPESPLYRQLVGRHTGDSLDRPPLFISEVS